MDKLKLLDPSQLNLLINISIIIISVIIISFFASKGKRNYIKIIRQLERECKLYEEIILGLENVGGKVSPLSKVLDIDLRKAIVEFYNNIRVQGSRETKIIVLERKMLEKREKLYQNLEEARVNLEILPFLGIMGTLFGFALPYFLNTLKIFNNKVGLSTTGIGFFLAASSTIIALYFVISLKRKYEAKALAQFDYFVSQERALEKIMLEFEGFELLDKWLQHCSNFEDEVNSLKKDKESKI